MNEIELNKKLEEQGISLSRQEINWKTRREVFTYHKNNQDCFQISITNNDVYFKEITTHNLSVEVLKIVIELMKIYKENSVINKESEEEWMT